jgi:hypothetical protein
MRRLVWMICLLAGVLAPVSAQSLGVHGSYLDVRDGGDAYGFGAVLKASLTEWLFVEGRISRYESIDSSSESGPLRLRFESDLTPIEVGLGLELPLGNSASVWLSGGLYWMRLSTETTLNGEPVPVDVDNNQGWYALAGLGTGDKVQLYIEVQYRTADAKLSSSAPVPALADLSDTDLHKVSANVGVRIRW